MEPIEVTGEKILHTVRGLFILIAGFSMAFAASGFGIYRSVTGSEGSTSGFFQFAGVLFGASILWAGTEFFKGLGDE